VKQAYYVIGAMRPRQWTKNLVVFAGLIFSRNLRYGDLAVRSVAAFCILCVMSGIIYIINDLADVEKDRLHPVKKMRPLASGALQRRNAVVAAAVLSVVALFAAWKLGTGFFVVGCAFFVLNLLYSFGLKRVVLLDVASISFSFILRAIAGVEALRAIDPGIEISPWLLICTLFLSLFLAFCKRRHELLTVENAAHHRESLQEYSPALLDQLVSINAGGSVLSYAIYTIWPDTVQKFGSTHLVYTVPLVLLGVMRYLYLVYNKQKGGSPADLLLHEKFLLADVLIWIVCVIAIIGDF